jgi:hypothetical protein
MRSAQATWAALLPGHASNEGSTGSSECRRQQQQAGRLFVSPVRVLVLADVRAIDLRLWVAFQSTSLGNIAVHSDIKSQGLVWVPTMCRLLGLFCRSHQATFLTNQPPPPAHLSDLRPAGSKQRIDLLLATFYIFYQVPVLGATGGVPRGPQVAKILPSLDSRFLIEVRNAMRGT